MKYGLASYIFLLSVILAVLPKVFADESVPDSNIYSNKSADIENIRKLAGKGEYYKAIEYSKSILAKSTDNLEARLILGNLYLETGQYQKAEELLSFFTVLTSSVTSKLQADDLLLIAKGTWLYATRKGDKNLFHQVVQEYLPRIEKLESRVQ